METPFFGLDGPYLRGQLTSPFLEVFPFKPGTASFRTVRKLIDTYVTWVCNLSPGYLALSGSAHPIVFTFNVISLDGGV